MCKVYLTESQARITLISMSVAASCRPRFTRPLFLWALAGLMMQMALEFFVGANALHPHLRFLLLLPLVPEAFFIGGLVRAILKMDELERRVTLESIAIAFGLTLVLTFALAALENAGVNCTWVRVEVGNFILGFWATAYIFSSRRYR